MRYLSVKGAGVGGRGEWRGLLETAAQLGVYCWAEQRLFEILGEWIRSERDERTKAALAAQSLRHGWHAEVLLARMPELAGVDVDALIGPPSIQMGHLFQQVADSPDLSQRLVGAHRVILGHLSGAYRSEIARLNDIADASTRRWLRLISDDVDEEVLWAEDALRCAMASGSELERLAACQLRFEQAMLAAGGLSI